MDSLESACLDAFRNQVGGFFFGGEPWESA